MADECREIYLCVDVGFSNIKDTELLRFSEEDLKVAPSFSFCYDCSCSIWKRRSSAGRRSPSKKTDRPIGVSLVGTLSRLMQAIPFQRLDRIHSCVAISILSIPTRKRKLTWRSSIRCSESCCLPIDQSTFSIRIPGRRR